MKFVKIINYKNWVAVIFLTVLIGMPILFVLKKHDKIDLIANKENTEFPVFDTSGVDGFIKQFDNYFTDNFPLKYDIITFSNRLKVKTIKSLNAQSKVIVGKNDWLFYNSTIFDSLGLNEYCGYKNWTPTQLNKVVTNINAIQKWCNNHNIHFELIICPNKQSIYPEFLPNFYTKQIDNRYDQLMNALPNLINVKRVLLNYKNNSLKLLYYKTDTHWNVLGAHVAVNQLYNKLPDKYKQQSNFEHKEIEDTIFSEGLDLANMIVLKHCYSDSGVVLKFKNHNPVKIPHLVVMHDSYLGSMEPSLNCLFTKITPLHLFDNGIPSPEFLLKEKTDVFMIELVERYKELLTWDIHPDYFK